MEKIKNKSEEYIIELEDKIIDLSLELKSTKNELKSVRESNNKNIGKLVHNLKNPVGVIFSFSNMMMEDIEDYSKEKLEKHLQIIKNSADFSIQLLNAVSKFSQFQSSGSIDNFESLNYIELVNNVIMEFDFIAKEKNITIERDFSEDSIFLTIDEEEISLAVKNILNNALRYSNENSSVKIRVRNNSNTIETVITDEGIGISEENLPSVLNEFFVVNTYSEDKQKCIGLGLSIANIIVQNHKGKISATSSINKGSSFIINLPK